MKRIIGQVRIRPVVVTHAACTLLTVVLLLSLAQTSLADLPPRHPLEPDCQSAQKPALVV